MKHILKKISHHKYRKQFHLKKDLTLFNATSAGVGGIIGAGIYVLIGAAAGLAGNSLWITFLFSSIIALFTGLSYAELSALFPTDAGEYAYVEKATNKFLAFIVGYLVVVTGIVAAAAIALGFAGYFSELLRIKSLMIIALCIIIFLSLVNLAGISHSKKLNIFLTGFELAGLLILILFGAHLIGTVNYLEMPNGFEKVLEATALIFFAYGGFESVVKLSEETKDARRVIPKALLLSIIITTTIYTLLGLVAVSAVGWKELSMSSAPLALVASSLLGSKAFVLLAIIAMLSTSNTILITLVSNSRMIYGIGSKVRKLRLFSKVNRITRTPHYAILLSGIAASFFVLFENIKLVAEIANFAIFLSFFSVNSAAIILRYKDKRKRSFRIPLNIGKFPVLSLLGAIFSIFMISRIPLLVNIYGISILLIGILLYYLIRER